MKKELNLRLKTFVAMLLMAATLSAQTVVPLGKGSYASSTPLEEYLGDPGYFQTYNAIHVEDAASQKPFPTNDWWSQMLVDVVNMEGMIGFLWAYPQRVGAYENGPFIDFPKEWNPTGNALQTASTLKILGDGFKATTHKVRSWSDWGVTFILTDEAGKEIETTVTNGIPYTFLNFKGCMPEFHFPTSATFFRKDGLRASFPMRGDCFGIEINGDHYGIFLPENTVIEKQSGMLSLRFTGTDRYMVVAAMPDANHMDMYYEYAFNKPIDTKLSWSYNEATSKLTTTYNITTKNLRGGAAGATIHGFIPHHYKNSNVQFAFNGIEYATPRGKMKCATGNTFTITYDFNGLIPWEPAPEENDYATAPFDLDLQKDYLSMFSKNPEYSGDVYYGGKSVQLFAQQMAYAYELGDMETFTRLKSNLTKSLTDWFTYTPGEKNKYFAQNDVWGAFSGYDNIYAAELGQDNHFEYGYYCHAAGILMMYDESFKQGYKDIAIRMAKQYANWKRGENLPFFRTFSPWLGHSCAGPFGDGGGNGQESTSESMQGWSGLYILAVALGDKEMRDAAIMGYTLESHAANEYWWDIDRENIDYAKYFIHPEDDKRGGAVAAFNAEFDASYPSVVPGFRYSDYGDMLVCLRPFNVNTKSEGVGWWTWFSGDPLWMAGIQVLPMCSGLKYLYQYPEYNKYVYDLTEQQREYFYKGGIAQGRSANDSYSIPGFREDEWSLTNSLAQGSAQTLGHVMMSYRQTFDPEGAAELWDWLHDRGAQLTTPSKGAVNSGISYYQIHSHLTYGDIRWDIRCDDPNSTAYLHKGTGRKCYVVYNAEEEEKDFTFYTSTGQVEQTFTAPAHKYTVYCDDAYLDSIQVIAEKKTVEQEETINIRAIGYDQHGAIFHLENPTWSIATGEGTLTMVLDTVYTYTATAIAQDEVIIKVSKINKNDEEIIGYDTIRVNTKPILTTIELTPIVTSKTLGQTEQFVATGYDQYGDIYELTDVVWSIEGTSDIDGEGFFTATHIGEQTIKATSEGVTGEMSFRVYPQLNNIALGKPATNYQGTRYNAVTDGVTNAGPQWQPAGAICNTDDAYIVVDLLEEYNITGLTVFWEGTAAYSSSWEAFLSSDGTNWTSVYLTYSDAGGSSEVTIAGVGRYVKIQLYENGHGGDWCGAIREIQVFGAKQAGEPELSGMEISPAEVMNQYQEYDYSVSGFDQYGEIMVLPCGTPTFTADKGSMTPDGHYIASEYGMVRITATCDAYTTYKDIYVNAVALPDSISIIPARSVVPKESEWQLNANIYTKFGQLVSDPTEITWAIEGDALGCTIDQNGLVTIGSEAGTITVTATADGIRVPGRAQIIINDFNNANLATRKSCWASSEQYRTFEAAKAVNSSLFDRWAPATNRNEWWYVDLEEAYLLDRIVIRWKSSSLAKDYSIEVSNDKKEWETIYSATSAPDLPSERFEVNNEEGTGTTTDYQSIQTINIEELNGKKIAGRYVRININLSKTDYPACFWEFEVYGEDFWNPVPTTINILDFEDAYVNTDQQFTAHVFDQDGVRMTGEDIVWTITDEAGEWLEDGFLRPTKPGTYTITATVTREDGTTISDSKELTIKEEPVLTKIAINPRRRYLAGGESFDFEYTCYDQFGNEMWWIEPVWDCDAGISVNQIGSVSTEVGAADGEYEVRATYGNITGYAYIIIGEEPPCNNLASGATISANDRPGEARLMIDGSYTSRWAGSGAALRQIDLDLGDIYSLNSVRITWDWDNSAADYEILASKDGTNWETFIIAEEMIEANYLKYNALMPDYHDKMYPYHQWDKNIDAQYLRINLRKSNRDDFAVYEIFVCGEEVDYSDPARIEITPSSATLGAEEQVTFTVTVYNGKDEVIENPTLEWNFAEDETVGVLTPNGSEATFDSKFKKGTYTVSVKSGTIKETVPVIIDFADLTPRPSDIVADDDFAQVGKTITYSVDDVENTTFTWTIPSNGTIISGQGTNTIVVEWSAYGETEISVIATLDDNDSDPTTLEFVVRSNAVPTIPEQNYCQQGDIRQEFLAENVEEHTLLWFSEEDRVLPLTETPAVSLQDVGTYTMYVVAVPNDCSVCGGDTATVTLNVYEVNPVTINIPQVETCPGTTLTLNALSRATGTLAYEWKGATGTTNEATITLSENCGDTNEVIVITTNEWGCKASDTVTIESLDEVAPTIELVNATTRDIAAIALGDCKYEMPDLSTAITVSDNCTDAADLKIEQSIEAGQAITETSTVTVTVSDACGNSDIVEFNVTVPNGLPAIKIVGEETAYPGTDITLETEWDIPEGATPPTELAWTWTNVKINHGPMADLTTSATCDGEMDITLKVVERATGCSSEASFTIKVIDDSKPVINAGNAASGMIPAISNGDCTFAVPDFKTIITVTDNDGTNTENITISQDIEAGKVITETTPVTITATDACGNIEEIEISVEVPETLADVTIEGDNETCPGAEVTLSAVTRAVGVTYTWSNADVTPVAATAIATAPATNGESKVITVTITDENGCSKTSAEFTLTAVDNEAPVIEPLVDVLEIEAVAAGSCTFTVPDVTTLVTAEDNCSDNVTISQNITVGAAITENTIVTITATDASGNIATENVTVTVPETLADVTIEGDNETCPGAEVTLSAVTRAGGVTYTWSNADVTPVAATAIATAPATNGESKVITVTITDENGCSKTSADFTLTAVDNEAPVIAGYDRQVEAIFVGNCVYEVPNLIELISNNVIDNCSSAEELTFQQSIEAGMPIVETANVDVYVTDASGNKQTATFEVVVNSEAPTFTIRDITPVCAPATINLAEYVDADNNIVHYYTNEALTDEIQAPIATETTKYYVQIQDVQTGCKSEVKEAIVQVDEIEINFAESITIVEGAPAEIWIQGVGDNANTYQFEILDGNNIIEETQRLNKYIATDFPTQETTYTLVAENGACKATATTTVTIKSPLEDLPQHKFFTPDGDGLNDTWCYINPSVQDDSKLTIFDRFGKCVFESTVADGCWDGEYNGHPMPSADYWWTVQDKFSGKRFKGHFTLLR